MAGRYLAIGLALPFLVLALPGPGRRPCCSPRRSSRRGIGIAVWSGRLARTRTEAGEALSDTLLAHTARGERARIARELHDVVAHHISMIAVLSETGRLTTPGLPEAGARRFLEIGDTARAGLTEMRRLLGVLRRGARRVRRTALPSVIAAGVAEAAQATAVRASRQPQPGLRQLAELIDAARDASAAGTRLIISGPVTPLDPGVELAAYRIVQEALTNTRRHAPGAAVDVELRYSPQALRLRVRDNGPGPVAAGGSDQRGPVRHRTRPGQRPPATDRSPSPPWVSRRAAAMACSACANGRSRWGGRCIRAWHRGAGSSLRPCCPRVRTVECHPPRDQGLRQRLERADERAGVE